MLCVALPALTLSLGSAKSSRTIRAPSRPVEPATKTCKAQGRYQMAEELCCQHSSCGAGPVGRAAGTTWESKAAGINSDKAKHQDLLT